MHTFLCKVCNILVVIAVYPYNNDCFQFSLIIYLKHLHTYTIAVELPSSFYKNFPALSILISVQHLKAFMLTSYSN